VIRDLQIRAPGVVLVLTLAGCVDAVPDEPADEPCNTLDDSHCLLPFPSSAFLVDADTPTGHRVSFGPDALPATLDGVQTDPERWNRLDGFSTLGPILALLPGADASSLAGPWDIETSVGPDATTVILDAATGEPVPHFAELDAQSDDPERQVIVLHPAQPLDWDARYVVGMRGVTDSSGLVLDAPAGFAGRRDAGDVPPELLDHGWTGDELQLAWDFHTASEDGTLRTVRHVVDEALAWAGSDGPPYRIDELDELGCDEGQLIGRQVEGVLEVPLFLETWEPGGFLRFDSEGLPLAEGTVEVPFMARVPCALIDDPRAAIPLQFGHGLFGDRKDVRSSSLERIADALPAVLLAVDWTGMKDDDVAPITLAIGTDVSDFATIPDRLHHGHMETLLAARALRGALGRDEVFQSDGVALIDDSAVHFYGNSQGAVLGGATLALGTDYDRAILGVPGAPFSLLLPRAQGFVPFFFLLQAQFSDAADIPVLIALMQMLWDPTESGGHMPNMQTPVLKQAAIGDSAVTTLGAHVMARGFKSSLVAPATRDVPGLESREPPFEGSALVEFDFGVAEPDEAVPADTDLNTHDNLFGDTEAQAQVVHFLQTGEVIHVCEGPCDPD